MQGSISICRYLYGPLFRRGGLKCFGRVYGDQSIRDDGTEVDLRNEAARSHDEKQNEEVLK